MKIVQIQQFDAMDKFDHRVNEFLQEIPAEDIIAVNTHVISADEEYSTYHNVVIVYRTERLQCMD